MALLQAFIQLRFLDLIDIILVALLIYFVFNLIRGTVAINILLGILSIYVIWYVVRLFEMELLTGILGEFISVGVLALIIVFQPEIRKFLLLIGKRSIINKGPQSAWRRLWQLDEGVYYNYSHVVKACESLSESKTGALIVITKDNSLDYYLEAGEIIDSRISDQLIQSIFYTNNPLHDGAIIITHDRIKAARCILPVSSNTNIPKTFGLRHRAAIGITEQSDAISIILSEQTGKISFCKNGEIKKNLSTLQLSELLTKEFSGFKSSIKHKNEKNK